MYNILCVIFRLLCWRLKCCFVVIVMVCEIDLKKRVVITGMGLCFVFGNDYIVYYDKFFFG